MWAKMYNRTGMDINWPVIRCDICTSKCTLYPLQNAWMSRAAWSSLSCKNRGTAGLGLEAMFEKSGNGQTWQNNQRLVWKVWFLCDNIPCTILRTHSLTANPGLYKGDVIKAYWGLFLSPRVVTEEREREQNHSVYRPFKYRWQT